MAYFTPDERERYTRHLLLKEIGGPGQQKLKQATVALVGIGGLGAPAAMYLAAAGVGQVRLIDHDAVSLSNLQRQILFDTGDVGRDKTDAARTALLCLNPHVAVETIETRLTHENASELLEGAAVVLDGSDSFRTRHAVNAACHEAGAILISGAVGRFDGHVATFKSGLTRGRPVADRAPCYGCLVSDTGEDSPTCSELGIIGALTGVIGSMMALEAIKEITGAGQGLAGRLFVFDGLRGESRVVRLPADPQCSLCGDH